MNKKYTAVILLVVVVAISIIFVLSKKPKEDKTLSSNSLTPVNSITHSHGLAVDTADSNKLYIATHHGLLVLINEKDLYQVGNKKDDYMGFSPHPSIPNIFFTSGHPENGGNLGFQKSEDGGISWKKISDGIDGPVDFHAMTINPVNPNLIFGWYSGRLQRSMDGGANWQAFSTKFVITSLVADPKDENILYTTNPQGLGIMVSKNKGEGWDRLSEQLKDDSVLALAIHPQDPQKLICFSQKLGLAKSSDGGKTWQKIDKTFDGEQILFLAFARQAPEIMYALSENNTIYKSSDGGNAWSKFF